MLLVNLRQAAALNSSTPPARRLVSRTSTEAQTGYRRRVGNYTVMVRYVRRR
jgi:hypothetical protein